MRKSVVMYFFYIRKSVMKKLHEDDVMRNHPGIGDVRLTKVNTFDLHGRAYNGRA